MLCECGREIDSKDFNYFLMNTSYYCSIECFLNELKCINKSPLGSTTARRSRLSNPHEAWSMVSKSFYRSLFEVKFADILFYKNITYLYEPLTLTLSNGQEYTPDFYLVDYKCFVELKGVWSGSGKKKVKQAIKDGVNIRLLPYYLSKSLDILHKQLKESNEIFKREN